MNHPADPPRPLSPHLQIYKIQITSLLSILHRGTGIFLYLGTFLWAFWFVSLSEGRESYQYMQSLLLHPIGLLFLLAWTFSFFYHLSNGIRHLLWDMGVGYTLSTVRITGWIVVLNSIFLTCVLWITGFLVWRIWV